MGGYIQHKLRIYHNGNSKCDACFSPPAGNSLELHFIDRLPSALLTHSKRFSTGVYVFENLSVVYQHVLVMQINENCSQIVIAVPQSRLQQLYYYTKFQHYGTA